MCKRYASAHVAPPLDATVIHPHRPCLYLELHNNHTCIQEAASALQGGMFRNDHAFRAHIIYTSDSYSALEDIREDQCMNSTVVCNRAGPV